MNGTTLRDVIDSDLPVFYAQQLDPEANRMAAFGSADPTDRAAFDAKWSKIRTSGTNTTRTVLDDAERVAGYVCCFVMDGELDVGYWLGREFWRRGIATEALRQLIAEIPERPLGAWVAKDNPASIRVLQKCGFEIEREGAGYAAGRGAVTSELLLQLK